MEPEIRRLLTEIRDELHRIADSLAVLSEDGIVVWGGSEPDKN